MAAPAQNCTPFNIFGVPLTRTSRIHADGDALTTGPRVEATGRRSPEPPVDIDTHRPHAENSHN